MKEDVDAPVRGTVTCPTQSAAHASGDRAASFVGLPAFVRLECRTTVTCVIYRICVWVRLSKAIDCKQGDSRSYGRYLRIRLDAGMVLRIRT